MFISLIESNAFGISHNTHYMANNPRLLISLTVFYNNKRGWKVMQNLLISV